MIRNIIGLYGVGNGTEITNYRYNRFMQPIINPSYDAGAIDNAQASLLEVVETETEWRCFYSGANTQSTVYAPDGQAYFNNDATFLAIKTKSNDVSTGWNKFLDVNGDPKPVLKPSFVGGRFDYWQVWIRTIIVEGGTWKAWYVGDDGTPTFDYRVGYATSTDEGETWTKSGTTPIYTDLLSTEGSRGIPNLRVINDGTNYKMLYAGVAPDVNGLTIAESADGITSWSVIHSGLFAGSQFGFPADFKYEDGVYYLWFPQKNRMPSGNLGPCEQMVLFQSVDLTTWTTLGIQLSIRGSQEFGIGNSRVLQKPNGEWFILYVWYINRTQAVDALNNTKEPSNGTKIADSNNTGSFIMNSACTFQYPDNVTFHAPLGISIPFYDVINDAPGTLSSGIGSWVERDHLKLIGSQTITFTNSGSIIEGEHFGVKMRVQVLTTGTHELFRIGNDIIMSLESGKLRVRLSSDGLGYEKDYITNVNISKPAGMDYIDDHIYIAFLWDGSTIRIWNDFVEFTAGEITKTVDDALTTVNNSGANILIGQNAAIELRSVSILDAPTATELVELDI